MKTEKPLLTPFYQAPFVFLFLFFLFGIELASLGFEISVWIALVFSLTASFLLLGKKCIPLRVGIQFLLIFSLTALLGVLSSQEYQNRLHLEQFAHTYHKGDFYIGKVVDYQEGKKDWDKGILEIEEVKGGSGKIQHSILFFYKQSDLEIMKGDRLLLSNAIEKVENKGNPGEFDAKSYWNHKGIYYLTFFQKEDIQKIDHVPLPFFDRWLQSSSTALKEILMAHLKGDELDFALAILLGDKTGLSEEIKDRFSRTGAMHVLAVSGLHIGIIMQFFLAVLSWFSKWISRKQAILFVVALLWIYAFLAGFSPSIVRAVFMFSVLSLSELSGRQYHPINVLFFTAFVLLLVHPPYLYDIGFQLSFLAMLGIFLFYKPIQDSLFFKVKALQWVWSGTAVGLAAQIMTAPISLYYFHQFPNYFILTNIGLMLFTGLILGLGIILMFTHWLLFLAKLNAFLFILLIQITLWLVFKIETFPGSVALGYELSFLDVLWLGILSFLLFKQFHLLPWRIALLAVFFILLGQITYQRFGNMDKTELVLYHANHPVISYKKGSQTLCFYADLPKEKVERLLSDYTTTAPSSVLYKKLSEDRRYVIDDQLIIDYKKNSLSFNYQNQWYELAKRRKFIKPNAHFISYPWFDGNAYYSLKNGALIW